MTHDDDNLKPGDVPLCKDCRLKVNDSCCSAHVITERYERYGITGEAMIPAAAAGWVFCQGRYFEPRRSWWQRLKLRWWTRTETDRLKGEIARTK